MLGRIVIVRVINGVWLSNWSIKVVSYCTVCKQSEKSSESLFPAFPQWMLKSVAVDVKISCAVKSSIKLSHSVINVSKEFPERNVGLMILDGIPSITSRHWNDDAGHGLKKHV